MSERGRARELAAEAIESGCPLEWFDRLYLEAAGDESVIPWADMSVNPNLTSWLDQNKIQGEGRKALIVGCGLGDDAEALATLGFAVTAFDISETCISWCKQRFPASSVEYIAADLFDAPVAWHRGFDLVFESCTLQVLPPDLRQQAMRQIAEFVAPAGTLLVIARGRDERDESGRMPWPLLRSEFATFTDSGLDEVQGEDYFDSEELPVRRFRLEYHRRPENPADDLTDDQLVAAFEDCSLPLEQWSHRSHVRVAFVYSSRHDLETATHHMRNGVKSYNQTHRIPEALDRGYHETITVAFMRLVYAAILESGLHDSSNDFCDAHPDLLSKQILKSYYSSERIMSPKAKAEFATPDLQPLPDVTGTRNIDDDAENPSTE